MTEHTDRKDKDCLGFGRYIFIISTNPLILFLKLEMMVNYQYNVQLTYNELRIPESYLKIVYLRF